MKMKNCTKKKIWILLGIAILLAVLGGSLLFQLMIQRTSCEKDNVQYGIEVLADINGDKRQERVFVKDIVNGDNAFTQISAKFEDGETIFKDYPDYWSSYIMTGDLTEDGISDVVLMRFAVGSTYRSGEFSVLHMNENEWKEYPDSFIANPRLKVEQPENFEQLGCVGVSIVPINGQCRLRIIAVEDIWEDTVKCIDCSYQKDGWFIEDIQIIEKYYEMNKESELLGINL